MKQEQNYQQLFDTLAAHGIPVSDEYKKKIHSKINQVVNYEPLVGVFGKTGAGKSSLCNAVFGREICAISDVEACTRAPQEVILGLGNKGMKLLDVPGVGESRERDEEYAGLYKSLLPKLDLVLWVLKGDDRAFSSDEAFYKQIVKPHIDAGKPFLMVINQMDKIEPFREWDEKLRRPGVTQAKNIETKRRSVSGFFDLPLEKVIPVSAQERYGLVELVDAIVHSLPNEKKATVLKEVKEDNRSPAAKKEAEEGFFNTLINIVVDVIPAIPKLFKEPVKMVLRKVADWFSSWW